MQAKITHALPDVRDLRTSGNGCYQSPPFLRPRDQKKRRFWGREWVKSSTYKKLSKHWLGSLHLERECGACLNAGELTIEKKVDMGKNLSPKYCSNRKTSTSEIQVCRFNGGLKVAPLKS